MQVTRISLSIPPGLLPRIDNAARALEMSRSEFVTRTLESALTEGEALLSVMSNERVRSALLEAFTRPGVMQAVAQSIGQELKDADRQRVLEFMRPSKPAPARPIRPRRRGN